MEDLVSIFRNASTETTAIRGGGARDKTGYDSPLVDQYIVYEAYISLNPLNHAQSDQTHNSFFYDIPRNRNPDGAFDKYELKGIKNITLNFVSYLILYALIAGALLSVIYVFYLLYMDKKLNSD